MSIVFLIIVMIFLLIIGVLVIRCGANENSLGIIGTGLFIWIIFGILLHQVWTNQPSVQDPNRETFYRIVKMDIGNGVSKQIAILPNEKMINVGAIGEKSINAAKVYPDNSILRRYGYQAKVKWIKYDNGDSWFYEVIVPNHDRYEEAKEKIVEVKILGESIN